MKMDWPSAIKINWPPVWVSQAGLFYDFFSTRDQFRTSIYRIRFLWFISCLRGSQSRIPRNPKQENFFSKKVKYMKENWPLFFLRYGVNLKWFSGVNWISSQGVNSYHIFHVPAWFEFRHPHDCSVATGVGRTHAFLKRISCCERAFSGPELHQHRPGCLPRSKGSADRQEDPEGVLVVRLRWCVRSATQRLREKGAKALFFYL